MDFLKGLFSSAKNFVQEKIPLTSKVVSKIPTFVNPIIDDISKSIYQTTNNKFKELSKNPVTGGLKTGASVAKGAVDFLGEAFIKAPLRLMTKAGLTGIESITGKEQQFTPETDLGKQFLRDIYGTDTLKSFQKSAAETSQKVEEFGGSSFEQNFIPVVGVAGSVFMDLPGFGKTTKPAINAIAKSTEKGLVENLAKEVIQNFDTLEPGLKEVITNQLVKADSPKAVELVLKNIKNLGEKISKETFDVGQEISQRVAAQEVARGLEKTGIAKATKEFINDTKRKLVDFTAPIEDTLNSYLRKTGTTIAPSKNVKNQIDMVLRAPTLAGKFAEDNGLIDVIKNVENYDEFNQYLIAKHGIDVDTRGITVSADPERYIKDKKIVDALEGKYIGEANKVVEYSQKLLDYSVESGLVDRDTANMLKERYKNYVPFERIFSEAELAGGYQGTKGVANLSKQTAVQSFKGSEREIQNPLESLMERTYKIYAEGEKNKAASLIASYKDLPGNPFQIKVLRNTEDVLARKELYKDAAGLKELQDKVYKKIGSKQETLRTVERELNKLNKEGLQTYLSKSREFYNPEIVTKTKVTIKPEEFVVNAPKNFDELKNSYSTKDVLQKEFSNFNLLEQEIKQGGWSRLVDLGIDKNVAKSVAEQIFKEPTYKPKVTTLETIYSETKTKKIIENLISLKDTELDAIKRKIENREPKISKLLEDVSALKNEYNSIKETKQAVLDEAFARKDLKPDRDIISYFDNGVKNIIEVPKEIAEAAKNLNEQQLNVLGKMLALPTRVAKIGITGLSAPFIATNVVRDQISSSIFSKRTRATNALSNLPNFAKSLWAALSHNDLYDDFVRAGAGGTSFDLLRNQPKLSVEKIRSTKNLASRLKYATIHPVKTAGDLLRTIEDIVGRSEELTRLQQFRGTREAALKEGMSVKDAVAEAASQARENSVNFYRRGEWGKVLNGAFLYLNASIQGSRLTLRRLKESPIKTSAKIATALIMPSAIITAYNLSDPERKKVYDDIEDYEKENNFIIIMPGASKDEQKKWNVIKIPKPAGISQLTVPVQRSLEYAANNTPFSIFKDMVQPLVGSVSPVGSTLDSIVNASIPQAIKPSIQSYANYNFFTKQNIVPDWLKDASPKEQAFDFTSGTARAIAEKFNVSPIKVEQFIKDTGGTVAQQLLNASDRALHLFGLIPEEQIGGTGIIEGVIGRFTKAKGDKETRDLVEKVEEAISKQKDESLKVGKEAKKMFKELSSLPSDEANARLDKIIEESPILGDRIMTLLEEQQLGITYEDKILKQLNVKNGARARMIYEIAMNEFETSELRNEYLNQLIDKGIISEEVDAQIAELIEQGKK